MRTTDFGQGRAQGRAPDTLVLIEGCAVKFAGLAASGIVGRVRLVRDVDRGVCRIPDIDAARVRRMTN